MALIITSILSSTVGLLLNKVRDINADKLKDGDITDAKLRELLVTKLNNANFKLDALSRKDLLSSYTFLKEGVEKLNAFLEKENDEQKAVLNEASKDVGGETSRMPSGGVESRILNEALQLSYAMEKLKVNPDQEFESAIERFKKARERATEAFCNEALSIQDRILATKFKVVSEILECLASPETAISGCLSFLKDLHSLPAVREIFSVYLSGGVKSMMNKEERAESVKSVMLINYVLYKFVLKFSGKYFTVPAWPTIELARRSLNPIQDWCEVSRKKSWGGELIQPPNVLTLDKTILPYRSAVTGRRQMVAASDDCDINVISSTGESKVVKLPYPKHGEVIKQSTLAVASDSNNNVYVVKEFKISTESDGDVQYRYVLFVLDENYNAKHDCILHFIEDKNFNPMRMAINKNNDIIMAIHDDSYVYVCDNTGQLKHKFQLDQSYRPHKPRMSISDKNEIMITSRDDKVVQIYRDGGKLKSKIPAPKDHEFQDLAFHYGICKLILLAEEKESYHLLCYSEAGKLETSTCLGKDYECQTSITSHPSGVLAIIDKTRITFL